ncbi:MAG TPA: hypothetical protein VLE22_28050 [Bryobacteraceae bacterium]|nr:hypothetical protein [Bryobacteraceae bacterium]
MASMTLTMWQQAIIYLLCLIVAVGSIGTALWALLTGQVGTEGMDGLFLIAVSLLFAFTFSLTPIQALRRGFLRDLLASRKAAAKPREERDAGALPADEAHERTPSP